MKLKNTHGSYYILVETNASTGEVGFVSVSGAPIKIKGWEKYDLFIYRRSIVPKEWSISEGVSGQEIRSGKTQREAKQKVIESLSKVTKKVFDDIIERSIEDYGISPRYGGK